MPNYIYPSGATSANTEYVVCQICSGTTSTVVPPHPIWTNGQNQPIIQMNAVTLGGVNGLNN